MKILIKEQIGKHRYKTPEGYLICTDCILSRTGKQQYQKRDIWGDSCEDADSMIDIDRHEKDVFDEKAMASFENKAIALDHPEEDINVDNYKDYSVGFVRDIKKGMHDGQPVMTGTLVITDSEAIKKVESGEYEDLSCGYDCDITTDNNPCQINIRGNHVALCKEGRAGIAKISDSKVNDEKLDETILKVGQNVKLDNNSFTKSEETINEFTVEGFWYENKLLKEDPTIDKESVRGFSEVMIKNKNTGKKYTVNRFQLTDSIDSIDLRDSSDSIKKYDSKVNDSYVVSLKNGKYLDEYGQEKDISKAHEFKTEKQAIRFAVDVGYSNKEYSVKTKDSFAEIEKIDTYGKNLRSEIMKYSWNILSKMNLQKSVISQIPNYLGNIIEIDDTTGKKERKDRFKLKTKFDKNEMKQFENELKKKYDKIIVDGNDIYIDIDNLSWKDSNIKNIKKVISIVKLIKK